MEKFWRKGWSLTFLCAVIGFLLTLEIRQEQDSEIAVQSEENLPPSEKFIVGLKMQAGLLPLEGQGVIVTMDDSTSKVRADENPNLYVIHDDDILRVINELRAAGAEAISINGQRLIATSEIRCAGPTLSVNNVRSAPPYEISAIGDKNSLEKSIRMRGGVEETLKVWGIRLKVESSDEIYIPAYTGEFRQVYSRIAEERGL